MDGGSGWVGGCRERSDCVIISSSSTSSSRHRRRPRPRSEKDNSSRILSSVSPEIAVGVAQGSIEAARVNAHAIDDRCAFVQPAPEGRGPAGLVCGAVPERQDAKVRTWPCDSASRRECLHQLVGEVRVAGKRRRVPTACCVLHSASLILLCTGACVAGFLLPRKWSRESCFLSPISFCATYFGFIARREGPVFPVIKTILLAVYSSSIMRTIVLHSASTTAVILLLLPSFILSSTYTHSLSSCASPRCPSQG